MRITSSTAAAQTIDYTALPLLWTIANRLRQRVLLCIERISELMASNRLRPNPSKSEFLWCTILRRCRLLDCSTFALGDAEVRPAETIRNLGVHFDSCMTMTAQVSQLAYLSPLVFLEISWAGLPHSCRTVLSWWPMVPLGPGGFLRHLDCPRVPFLVPSFT